jgi:predicted amidohydrolase YtcJ
MKKLLFLFVTTILFGCNENLLVDTIVHNANIYTVDDAFSKQQAFAIKDGKIVEVGAENQILNKYTASEVIDAKQGYLFPGLIDAHCHFLGYGVEKNRINLVGTDSFEDVINKIEEYIARIDSKWVLGRGWDQNDWSDKSFPTNDTLSKLFPDHFIAIKRIDGHAFLASKNVLELAEVTSETKVEGGEIILSNSLPTGILVDNAMGLITKVLPENDRSFMINALLTAQTDCAKVGLTTVSDAGLSPENIRLIDSLQESNSLKMRVYAMISASNSVLTDLEKHRLDKPRLNVNSIKIYADGALGSRGAYLLEPYSDHDHHQGFLITDKDSLRKWAKACYNANFQMNVHSIGDGANNVVLQVMGDQLKQTNDRRWRIEHAQVVSDTDIDKFSQFTILPSVQPTHATSDMPWAEDRLGKERIKNAYSYQRLLQQNGLIALGTDFPVESISPFKTFYAAIERKDETGQPAEGFLADQALSREEALRGMTIWAAMSNFQELNRGSIEKGKYADFIILDIDLMTCKAQSILDAQVEQTWINGELIYEKR